MRTYRFLRTVVALIFVWCILARPVPGQNANSGELKGTVMDPSDAVVPGVAISIKNVQT